MFLTTRLPEWTRLAAEGRPGKKGEDKGERREKSSPMFKSAIYLSLNLFSPPVKTYINLILVHMIKKIHKVQKKWGISIKVNTQKNY